MRLNLLCLCWTCPCQWIESQKLWFKCFWLVWTVLNVQECLDLCVMLLFTFQMQSSNATVPLLWRTQLPPQTQLNLVHWSLTTACLDTPSTGMVQLCAPCTHFNGLMCPNAKVYERIRVIWNFSNSLVSRMLHVTTTCCTCDYLIILQHSNTPPEMLNLFTTSTQWSQYWQQWR